VKSTAAWRKSTHSVTGECVEVGEHILRIVAVRDNKDTAGSHLFFTKKEWREFVGRVKASE
jgi:Domain of unknown function (DUF397)